MRLFNYLIYAVLITGIGLSSCRDKNKEDTPTVDPTEPIDPVKPFKATRETDSLALVALYNACGGADWSTSWDLHESLDSWHGITLTRGRVDAVDLQENNLKGKLTEELSTLDKLYYFNVSNNSLTGTLPDFFTQTSTLNFLYLNDNKFTGTIPTKLVEISNRSGMSLNIINNFITAPIPNGMSLHKGDINYRYQYHPDDINKENVIDIAEGQDAMPCNVNDSLALVALYHANSEALKDMWDIQTNVQNWHGVTLHIQDDELIVSGINLSNYAYSMQQCKDNGQTLGIVYNSLISNIPTEFGNLKQLRFLQLSDYSFTSFPSPILELSNLEWLKMRGCGIRDIPNDIDRLAKLKFLQIDDNSLNGKSIPTSLFNCSELLYLCLSECGLTCELPQEIGQLKQLRYLDLGSNHLYGNIPSSMGELHSLEMLLLYENNFTGKIPEVFGNLGSLTSLELSYNNFSGTIPPSLGDLTELRELAMSGNLVTGTIPQEFGNLSNLEYLDMEECPIEGEIPTTFTNLKSLESLYFNSTNLSGNLPEFLPLLPKLQGVDLDNCYFTGTIPASYYNTNWGYMYIEQNFIIAPVPEPMFGNYRYQYHPDDINKQKGTYDITNSNLRLTSTQNTLSSKKKEIEKRNAYNKKAMQDKLRKQLGL
ncbi:MAG: leucine-rich repeat domain-containing protein [Marinifilaceae bacterium]